MARSQRNDVYQWKELNIEEPFDLSNTARSVYDYATFERVKAIFMASAHRLDHTLDLASIFRPIIHHVPDRFPYYHQQQQQQFEPPQQPRSGDEVIASSKLIIPGSGDTRSIGAEARRAQILGGGAFRSVGS